MPDLVGRSRDEVKAALKSERAKVPRRRFTSRQRTSRFMGVGSSNRRNQWQARILVHGKARDPRGPHVTVAGGAVWLHLGWPAARRTPRSPNPAPTTRPTPPPPR